MTRRRVSNDKKYKRKKPKKTLKKKKKKKIILDKTKAGAKSTRDKRKESFSSFRFITDELSIKTFSGFTGSDLSIVFDEVEIFLNPFNIIGKIKSIDNNRPPKELNEYGKSVVKYLKTKTRIDLVDLFDKGILFILYCDENLANGFNSMFSSYLTEYLDYKMKNISIYSLDRETSNIKGSIYFNHENNESTSQVYKIHISVKQEYLFDALELFSYYPKLEDFPSFKIVFPKFQHSEYKQTPHFMQAIDEPLKFLREYEEITGATAAASIVIYPFSDKDEVFEDEILLPFMKFWNENCDDDWAREHNYLWFNTRIGTSLYFAYGYDTAQRLGCVADNNERDCVWFRKTENLTKLQERYCGNEDFSDDDMKCLKDNFNLDLDDLCDNSENSIPNVWGTRRKMKEIKHVKNKCLTKKTKQTNPPEVTTAAPSISLPRKDFKKNIVKMRVDTSKKIDSQIEELERKIKLLESSK